LLAVVHPAKRNKAFENCFRICLALDGTGAGWRSQAGCTLGRPQRNAQKEILGYQHRLVLVSVVGTGYPCPSMWNPTGQTIANMPPDSDVATSDRWLEKALCAVRWRIRYGCVSAHGERSRTVEREPAGTIRVAPVLGRPVVVAEPTPSSTSWVPGLKDPK
jgi:hypothetical protein